MVLPLPIVIVDANLATWQKAVACGLAKGRPAAQSWNVLWSPHASSRAACVINSDYGDAEVAPRPPQDSQPRPSMPRPTPLTLRCHPSSTHRTSSDDDDTRPDPL